jgi:hypothetical protein
MAADAVLRNYRENKGLSLVTIKSPRGSYRRPEALKKAGNGEGFEGDSSGIHSDAKVIRHGR